MLLLNLYNVPALFLLCFALKNTLFQKELARYNMHSYRLLLVITVKKET